MSLCLRDAAACRYHPTNRDLKQDFLYANEIIQGIVAADARPEPVLVAAN